MRITFIGTSHGVPEPNRKCSCTLIEIGDRKYLIDVGTDPIPELVKRGIHPNQVNAIFVTHTHGDHINGLVPFINLLSWHYLEANPQIFLPEIHIVDALRTWLTAEHDTLREDIRFTEIHEGIIFDDGVLRLTAFKTGHIENAYAFLWEAEGKRVLFTGDMKHRDGPTADYARFTADGHFDLVVAECAHFDAMLYLDPIRKNPPDHFCFNHYSGRHIESCYHLRAALKDEVPVTLVTDGYEISL